MITEKIPLTITCFDKDNYHVFVNAKIGRYKAYLLLDTGASKTVFDLKKVEQLLHKPVIDFSEAKSIGLGTNGMDTQVVNISNFKIGKIKVKPLTVALLDLSHVNETYRTLNLPEIHGVLGSDILVQCKAVINFSSKTLTIKG